MNQGIFGFPSVSSNTIISTTEIDVSGTYLIEPRTKRLIIFAVGGGGGGGGGKQHATGTTCFAGGGGGGGAIVLQDFNVEDLGGVNTTLSIIIGAGGNPGGGGSSANAVGTIGGTGGTTTITLTGKPGIIISCLGGNPGGGGTATAGAGGASTTHYLFGRSVSAGLGSGSTAGSSGFLVGTLQRSIASWTSHGGAGGTGLSSTPATEYGGSVYLIETTTTSIANPNYVRGLPGSNNGPWIVYGGNCGLGTINGQSSSAQIMGKLSPGFGGAGGGSAASSNGGFGGNGYRGSGGGGAGSASNTFTPGDGGRGGAGYVCIVALA